MAGEVQTPPESLARARVAVRNGELQLLPMRLYVAQQ